MSQKFGADASRPAARGGDEDLPRWVWAVQAGCAQLQICACVAIAALVLEHAHAALDGAVPHLCSVFHMARAALLVPAADCLLITCLNTCTDMRGFVAHAAGARTFRTAVQRLTPWQLSALRRLPAATTWKMRSLTRQVRCHMHWLQRRQLFGH